MTYLKNRFSFQVYSSSSFPQQRRCHRVENAPKPFPCYATGSGSSPASSACRLLPPRDPESTSCDEPCKHHARGMVTWLSPQIFAEWQGTELCYAHMILTACFTNTSNPLLILERSQGLPELKFSLQGAKNYYFRNTTQTKQIIYLSRLLHKGITELRG